MARLSSFGRLTAAMILAITTLSGSNAQTNQGRPPSEPYLPANCEDSEAYLDVVAGEALGAAAGGEVLIAVARMGNGETPMSLNRDRLEAVRMYLVRRGLPASNVVFARGERVSGLGRVEFYLSGTLSRSILARRNRGICTECCNPSPADFTPTPKARKRAAARP